MRGAFPLSILPTLRTTLLLPLVLFFFSVPVLNMLSAARIAQYNDWATGRTVQGSNSVTGEISLHQGVYQVAGVRLKSHPASADLKNVWRYTSTPTTFLRGVHMEYEGEDTTEQVTGQLNLASVELKKCPSALSSR